MALSRCKIFHSPPIGRTFTYNYYVNPIGYPNTAIICGLPDCEEPGVIWLTQSEESRYRKGIRIFPGTNNNFTKMRADDHGLQRIE